MGKLSAVDLQVIVAHATLIHPQPDTLVANELHRPDRLINGLLLGLVDSQFVLADEHAHPVCGPLLQKIRGFVEHSFKQIIPQLAGDGNTRGGGASSPWLKPGAFRARPR